MVSIKCRLLLRNNEKILLLQQNEARGGKFTLPGGKVEKREYIISALCREVFEETGLVISEENLQHVHTLQKIKKKENRIVIYFEAKSWTGTPVCKEPHKFQSLIWIDTKNLPNKISPTVKHIFKQIEKNIKFSQK